MKYCEHLNHTLCFNLNEIVPCCVVNSNGAPEYYNIYKNTEEYFNNIDIAKLQSEFIDLLNSEKLENYTCSKCIFLKDVEEKEAENRSINNIFLRFWTECNCDCVYCDNTRDKIFGSAAQYSPYKLIKKLYEENKIDAKNFVVRVQGGDLSVLPDFEDYMALFNKFGFKEIHFSTNNVVYQKSIEEVLRQGKGSLNVSLDCSTRETYKKIKQVDYFDTVIKNLYKYISEVGHADHITIHYIVVKGYNDNKKEINGFLKLMQKIGIKNIGIRIDHKDLDYYIRGQVPAENIIHYQNLIKLFYEKANELGFRIDGDVCIEQNFVLKETAKKKNFFQKLFNL